MLGAIFDWREPVKDGHVIFIILYLDKFYNIFLDAWQQVINNQYLFLQVL